MAAAVLQKTAFPAGDRMSLSVLLCLAAVAAGHGMAARLGGGTQTAVEEAS